MVVTRSSAEKDPRTASSQAKKSRSKARPMPVENQGSAGEPQEVLVNLSKQRPGIEAGPAEQQKMESILSGKVETVVPSQVKVGAKEPRSGF